MKKILILIFITCLFTVSLNAVFDGYASSARARGMGDAFYTVSDDADAAFYNPAGLDYADNQFNLGMVDLYGNSYARVLTASAAYRFSPIYGTIGLGMKQFSVDFEDEVLTTESTIALSHAFKILKDIHSQIAIGYTVNMYNVEYDGYGSQEAFGLNIGAVATMHRRTKLSFTIHNINNPAIGDDNQYELPRKMVAGISYQPYSKIVTVLELTKELKDDTSVTAGIEYEVIDMMTLRAGLNSNPATYSAGVGFDVYDFIVDYGLTLHSDLDPTHHVQVGYRF